MLDSVSLRAVYLKEITWNPYFAISSLGQNFMSLVFITKVTSFSRTLPVYSLVFGSHSLRIKMSPGLHLKSASLISNVFSPLRIFSKSSGHVFFSILMAWRIFICIKGYLWV